MKFWLVAVVICSIAGPLVADHDQCHDEGKCSSESCSGGDFSPVNPFSTLGKKLDELIDLMKVQDLHCNGGQGLKSTPKSCKEIVDTGRSDGDRAYTLDVGGKEIPVYCQVTPLEGCGAGGWTMVMKMDGQKKHFTYDSALWTDLITFNTHGGETGFDAHETKLSTYWKTPFSKICVGMKVGNKLNFQVIDQQATSLHSLIADGQYRATSLGRDKWKNLIGSDASLQRNCNREGFNAKSDRDSNSKARIGITSNNENDCLTNDSRIGFGTAGYPDNNQSCGNVARHGGDNGDKTIPAMGYILVQ